MTGNWSQVWEGAKNIVIGAVNAIISVFKGMINTITSGINTAVDAINSISVDIPKGVPGVGGKHIGFNVGKIPQLASGTNNWAGGIVQVHERGGEIIDLPNGSRVYPHDESIKKARKEGKQNISIAKLADSIIVREDADIDKIATALYQKLNKVAFNQGVT
jgi:phage tail tape measure protein, TP901 family